MDARIKFIERLKIQLMGHIYAGNEKREGWKASVPFYIFKCPLHGYVKNYAQGFNRKLICPECLKEEQNRSVSIDSETGN